MKRYLLLLAMIMAFSLPGFSAWSRVQSNLNYCGASASTCDAFLNTPTSGNLLLIVAMYNNSGTSISSVAGMSGGSGWTRQASCKTTRAGGQTIDMMYATSLGTTTNGGTFTVTFSAAAADADVYIFEYTGGTAPYSFDTCGTGSGTSSTTVNAGSITTTGANDLAVAVTTQSADISTPSIPSNPPWPNNGPLTNGQELVINALNFAATTTQFTFTNGAAVSSAGSTIAFKDSTGATSSAVRRRVSVVWRLSDGVGAGGSTPTYSLSGAISGLAGSIASVAVSGNGSVSTDGSGNYSKSGLTAGSYTLIPSASGYTFSPTSLSPAITSANVTGQNFTATATGGTDFLLQATHDEWTNNAGTTLALNEAHPHGVPSGWDQYTGAYIVDGNNPCNSMTTTQCNSANPLAYVYWGVVYADAAGNPATNTRVNIKACNTWWYDTNATAWVASGPYNQPEFGDYAEDFGAVSGDTNEYASNTRIESDGSISVKLTSGRVSHFYGPSARIPFAKAKWGGVVVECQARLIKDNSAGTDDTGIAKILVEAGADFYPAQTGPGITSNPGIGGGRMKYVTTSWRSVAFTSLSYNAIKALPVQPPIDLTGLNP